MICRWSGPGLLAFAVLAYVVLDGFDLGTGILFAVERGEEDRDVMVNTIAPVWDGNETWLVLGGGGLLAVFPLAYATIMPALYPTIIAMLLALVFRGVAFEFRFRAITAAGATRLGFRVLRRLGGGGVLPGLDARRAAAGHQRREPRLCRRLVGLADRRFTVLCGVAVVVGYALLGACWLVWRTEGDLQARCRRHARASSASRPWR